MTERICRYIELDRSKIDREAKTIPLSFSSEYPALQRCDGNVSEAIRSATGLKDGDVYVEVLDHDPANVDLSLLNNQGAFLDEHDERAQLGVVERAEVADKLGRAVVRMGNDGAAVTRFGQMADGIRPHISAGYKYTRFIGKEKLPNGRDALRFAWKGLELSSVAIPADPTIGVARSYQDLPQVDSPQVTEPKTKVTAVMENAVDEKKLRTDTLAAERTRSAAITRVADELIRDHGKRNDGKMEAKIRSMVSEALSGDETVEGFQNRAMKEVLGAKPAVPVLLADCTADPSRYSLIRGIRSALDRKARGMEAIPDGLEGEVHQEFVRRSKSSDFGGLGYPAAGFQVPADAPITVTRSEYNRIRRADMTAGTFAQGGAFVPTQLVVPIIELLRNLMVLDKVGIQRMAGLQGNIVIPRQEAAGTAYAVSEIGALTDTFQTLGQIALIPHRVGATQTYSKQFVMQSSPDAEAFMRDDLLKVIALIWDRFGLNGTGAGDEPLGIMNTPGVGSIVYGATPTYIKLLSQRTAIRKANVVDEISVVSTPATEGSLAGVAEALTGATTVGGAANAVWKPGTEVGEGRVVGCRAIASNQVPGDRVLFGAFAHLIHAMWGGLDVVVDQFTKAKNAETVITFNSWGDYALRHPEAFNVSADSGAQ